MQVEQSDLEYGCLGEIIEFDMLWTGCRIVQQQQTLRQVGIPESSEWVPANPLTSAKHSYSGKGIDYCIRSHDRCESIATGS